MHVEEVLWEALTKQYEAARVQEAKDIPTVRVLDAANVPQRKSAPARSSIVMAGMLLSLAVALMAVFTTSVWGEMDGRDERKIFVVELTGAMRSGLGRFCSLPGVSWVHARSSRSQGGAGNSWQIPHQD